MAGIFCKAYDKEASVEKAKSGFETAGLWPYDDQKFTDDDFCAADVTDKPLPTSSAATAGIDQMKVEQNCNAFTIYFYP